MASVIPPPVLADGTTIALSNGVLGIPNGAILNAQVGAAAAIAYSKLNLASSIQSGDLAAGVGSFGLCCTTAALGGVGTSTYFPLVGLAVTGAAGADSFDQEWVAPRACTVQNLLVQNETLMTGVGGTMVWTLMKNGVATALTVSVPAQSAARTNTEDAVHTVAVAKGDRLQLKCVIGVVNPGNIKFSASVSVA